MRLRRLELQGFRCLEELELELPTGLVVVSGGNGQGKSSLLEAVYLLATTRAAHASSERDLVAWDALEQPVPFCLARCELERGECITSLEVVVVLEADGGQERRAAKTVRVNGATRRAIDALGLLNVVMFTPRDLDLVDGAPSQRRRYLDVVLCQVDRGYTRALGRYNRLMAQRNHLLRRLRERGGRRGELDVWDERLASEGGIVLARRLEAVAELGDIAAGIHETLAGPPGSSGSLTSTYVCSPSAGPSRGSSSVESRITDGQANPEADCAELLLEALLEHRDADCSRGATSVGPHRDDLTFFVGGVDMRRYGSRGQQRTVALAWKLAEARLMLRRTGHQPVLLLDDVLSELDPDRREFLLAGIGLEQQTLLTTTEPDRLAPELLQRAMLLVVEGGRVRVEPRAGS